MCVLKEENENILLNKLGVKINENILLNKVVVKISEKIILTFS